MPKYKVKYYFDGEGEVTIEAKNEEEARANYFDGVWSGEEENGQNYQIEAVELID